MAKTSSKKKTAAPRDGYGPEDPNYPKYTVTVAWKRKRVRLDGPHTITLGAPLELTTIRLTRETARKGRPTLRLTLS